MGFQNVASERVTGKGRGRQSVLPELFLITASLFFVPIARRRDYYQYYVFSDSSDITTPPPRPFPAYWYGDMVIYISRSELSTNYSDSSFLYVYDSIHNIRQLKTILRYQNVSNIHNYDIKLDKEIFCIRTTQFG